MPDAEMSKLLDSQIAYYRARAAEYDQWFYRMGRFDRGDQANTTWRRELRKLERALGRFRPEGKVLEIACGTGLWTAELSHYSGDVTAIDASEEMLTIAKNRPGCKKVNYRQADIFQSPISEIGEAGSFDTIFFSFWLSHVPEPLFDSFWERVRSLLAPKGRVFFIDSRYAESSTAADHQLPSAEQGHLTRKLNDGREFRIVKVFHEPERLSRRLKRLGWQNGISETPEFFLFGHASL
jgi:2-polyprenyl-3-methyl-5-hydroxy-6-metoxy-1,4-benzoquinol methylase